MRAWVVHQPGPVASGPLRLVERPVPEPGPGELLLRVRAAGCAGPTCTWPRATCRPTAGRLPGHEVVGEVAAAGPRHPPVRGRRPGRGGLAARHLRHLPYCRRGQENLCPASRYTGWDADGGYAEYMVAPAAFAYPLPRGFTTLSWLRCCARGSSATGRCAAPTAARRPPGHLRLRRLRAPRGPGRHGPGRRGARPDPRRGGPASWPLDWAPRRRRTRSTRRRSRWTPRSCSPRSATWCPSR